MAQTIQNRISDLVGSNFTDFNSELELVCTAFNEIVDILPADLMIKYISDGSDGNVSVLNNSTTEVSVEGKKVVLVTRKDTAGNVRICKPTPFSEGLATSDNKSIYYMDSGNTRFPIYYIQPTGNLTVAPVTTATNTGKVYTFNYFTSDDGTSLLTLTGLGSLGFPTEAEYAGCLKSAIALLDGRISIATQEEEDAELLNMLQAQKQLLTQSLTDEVTRLSEAAE